MRASAEESDRVGLPASVILLLTVVAAFTVANLWYNQPLLPDIARTFHVSEGQAGMIAVLTQIGYAAGLLCFVPLGDAVDARRLMLALLGGVTVALLAAAYAPSLELLAAASFAIGLFTVVPQVAIPMAAALSPPEHRGRVVGQIVGGLLVGVLGARVLAGFIGAAFGWRRMFILAAAMMLVTAIAVRIWLPTRHPSTTLSYPQLMRSLIPIARTEPVIRDAALLGALTFGSFSAFWTTLAFRLEAPPLHYGSRVAGLFGLLGIAGAATAPIAGYFADKRSPRETVGYALFAIAISWIVLALAGHTLWGIAVGVVILDAGVQAAQVSNQARVYSLDAKLYGRLNTIYMTSYFAGGALGSALASAAWDFFGWQGVCAVGIALIVAALLRHRLAHPPA
jgi:predicted MFS family arabinose efflux permease